MEEKPKVQIDAREWKKGVVAGYYGKPDRGTTLSFSNGKIEGVAAAERGEPIDEYLARNIDPARRKNIER